MALWLTQPLTGMSTRNLPGGKGGPVRKDDNFDFIENVGASTSHNPMDPHYLLRIYLCAHVSAKCALVLKKTCSNTYFIHKELTNTRQILIYSIRHHMFTDT
jgi:hypothetical protein